MTQMTKPAGAATARPGQNCSVQEGADDHPANLRFSERGSSKVKVEGIPLNMVLKGQRRQQGYRDTYQDAPKTAKTTKRPWLKDSAGKKQTGHWIRWESAVTGQLLVRMAINLSRGR